MKHSPWPTTLTIVALSLLVLARTFAPNLAAYAAGTAIALLAAAVWLDRRAPWGLLLFRAGLLLGAGVLLGVLAFSKPQEPTGPPEPPPEPDPEQIVDAAHGFRLARPGPGWKLLPRERMPNPPYSRGVQAGAAGPDDVLAQVLILQPNDLARDPAEADNLETLASRHVDTFHWGEQRLEDITPIDFQGQHAMRYHVTGIDATGRRKAAECTLFARNNLVYILSAVAPEAVGHRADVPAFAAFAAAFRLID
jgi:hypothetical protein